MMMQMEEIYKIFVLTNWGIPCYEMRWYASRDPAFRYYNSLQLGKCFCEKVSIWFGDQKLDEKILSSTAK